MGRQGRHEKQRADFDQMVLAADAEHGPAAHCVIHLVFVVGRLVVMAAGRQQLQSEAEQLDVRNFR
mgnify:CR=1 FL=1